MFIFSPFYHVHQISQTSSYIILFPGLFSVFVFKKYTSSHVFLKMCSSFRILYNPFPTRQQIVKNRRNISGEHQICRWLILLCIWIRFILYTRKNLFLSSNGSHPALLNVSTNISNNTFDLWWYSGINKWFIYTDIQNFCEFLLRESCAIIWHNRICYSITNEQFFQ